MATTIVINKSGSFQNLPILKTLIRKTWKLEKVSMLYNPSKGLPNPDDDNYEDFPVTIFFKDMELKEDIDIHIHSLTCGYPGEGPHDFIEILNFLGIENYNEEDILTKKRVDEAGWIYLCYSN